MYFTFIVLNNKYSYLLKSVGMEVGTYCHLWYYT